MAASDAAIIGRRNAIISGLSKATSHGTLITDEFGLRTFETDALTAYRATPLAAVLPKSTAEVSRILKFCSENGVKVVARGAGHRFRGERSRLWMPW